MKPLPCVCTKGRLHKVINGSRDAYLADIINKTIAKTRNIAIEEAKRIKKLTKKECTIVMDAFGELEE
ncbi:hypothetical protein [Algibacter sp. PT7-4]|uniref:hypothetical protein n=1 Tax=Algibacter ulvanivorans TaxID=3400999 RepID=UPI003AACC588